MIHSKELTLINVSCVESLKKYGKMLFQNVIKLSSFEKDNNFTTFLNNYNTITQLTLYYTIISNKTKLMCILSYYLVKKLMQKTYKMLKLICNSR